MSNARLDADEVAMWRRKPDNWKEYLTPRHRAMLTMRMRQNMTLGEIGEYFHITKQTVSQNIRKALYKLERARKNQK